MLSSTCSNVIVRQGFKLTPRYKTVWERMTIRELGGFCTTFLLISGVASVFLVFIAPHVAQKEWQTKAVFAITIGLAALTLLFLTLSYLIDPGVIPQNGRPLGFEEMTNLRPGERLCHTCQIVRPKRAKHCKWCNHCVEVFDHHCPYVGTCIGAGNYIFFVGLMLSGTLAAGFVCGCSLYYASSHRVDTTSPADLVAVLLGAMGGLIVLATGHLCCYHALIAVTGETTNERILAKRAAAEATSAGARSATQSGLCKPVSDYKTPLIGSSSKNTEVETKMLVGIKSDTEPKDARPSLVIEGEEKRLGNAGFSGESNKRDDRHRASDSYGGTEEEESVVYPLNSRNGTTTRDESLEASLLLPPGKPLTSSKRTGSSSTLASVETNSRFTDL